MDLHSSQWMGQFVLTDDLSLKGLKTNMTVLNDTHSHTHHSHFPAAVGTSLFSMESEGCSSLGVHLSCLGWCDTCQGGDIVL
jgi:hypothetical protein